MDPRTLTVAGECCAAIHCIDVSDRSYLPPPCSFRLSGDSRDISSIDLIPREYEGMHHPEGTHGGITMSNKWKIKVKRIRYLHSASNIIALWMYARITYTVTSISCLNNWAAYLTWLSDDTLYHKDWPLSLWLKTAIVCPPTACIVQGWSLGTRSDASSCPTAPTAASSSLRQKVTCETKLLQSDLSFNYLLFDWAVGEVANIFYHDVMCTFISQ